MTAMREEQERPSKRYAVSVHQIAEMWTVQESEKWRDFIAVRMAGVQIPYRLYRRDDPPSGQWRRVVGDSTFLVSTEMQSLLDILWFNGKAERGS